jgi:hypothetical protein
VVYRCLYTVGAACARHCQFPNFHVLGGVDEGVRGIRGTIKTENGSTPTACHVVEGRRLALCAPSNADATQLASEVVFGTCITLQTRAVLALTECVRAGEGHDTLGANFLSGHRLSVDRGDTQPVCLYSAVST